MFQHFSIYLMKLGASVYLLAQDEQGEHNLKGLLFNLAIPQSNANLVLSEVEY